MRSVFAATARQVTVSPAISIVTGPLWQPLKVRSALLAGHDAMPAYAFFGCMPILCRQPGARFDLRNSAFAWTQTLASRCSGAVRGTPAFACTYLVGRTHHSALWPALKEPGLCHALICCFHDRRMLQLHLNPLREKGDLLASVSDTEVKICWWTSAACSP